MKCLSLLLLLSSLITIHKIHTAAAAASLDDVAAASKDQEGVWITLEGAERFFPKDSLSSSVLLGNALERSENGSKEELRSLSNYKMYYKKSVAPQTILDDISDLCTAVKEDNLSSYLDTKSEDDIAAIFLLADNLGFDQKKSSQCYF